MQETASPRINPYLAIILAAGALSFSSIFTRLAAAPALAVAFYRLFFSSLLVLPFLVKTGQVAELKRVRFRDLGLAALTGGFLACHFAVWITSLSYTTISSSTVLVTMQPLFVVTLGYLLFGEKLGWGGLVGLVVALTGSILVGFGDFRMGGEALWGDLLAFAGAFFEGMYVLMGRSLRARLSLWPYVLVVYGTASALLMIMLLVRGTPLYPYPPATWLWFLALALIPTIGGHTVYNWALGYVKAAVVSVSILGEPVGATILALFIFREVPGPLQLIGGLGIITGLYLFMRLTREN